MKILSPTIKTMTMPLTYIYYMIIYTYIITYGTHRESLMRFLLRRCRCCYNKTAHCLNTLTACETLAPRKICGTRFKTLPNPVAYITTTTNEISLRVYSENLEYTKHIYIPFS